MENYIKPNQNIQGKRSLSLNHKTIDFKIDSKFKLPKYKKLKVFVRTYGCQANIIDATNAVVGKLAVQIADILRGKNKADFTHNCDCGDHVIVFNCSKMILTGNKELKEK